MIYIYILLIILVLLIIKVVKSKTFVLLLFLCILIMLESIANSHSFFNQLYQITNNVIFNEYLLLILIFIFLLYFISEMFFVLGIQSVIESNIINKSISFKKIYVHIISIFSTNFDLEKSSLIQKYYEQYKISSFFNSLLNPLALTTLSFVVFYSYAIDDVSTYILWSIVIFNFISIYWFFKRIIDFKYSVKFSYRNLDNRLDKIKSTENILRYDKVKSLIIRFIIYAVIFAVIIIILPVISLLQGIILLQIVYLIDLFISAEIFIQKTKVYSEKYIFDSLLSGFKSIFKYVSEIVLAFLTLSAFTSFLAPYMNINYFGEPLLMLLMMILGGVITYVVKDYYYGLIMTLPFISLAVNGKSYMTIYYLLIYTAIIILAQQLAVMKAENRTIKEFTDVFLMIFLAAISYLLFILSGSVLLYILTLVLSIFIYYLLVLVYFRR